MSARVKSNKYIRANIREFKNNVSSIRLNDMHFLYLFKIVNTIDKRTTYKPGHSYDSLVRQLKHEETYKGKAVLVQVIAVKNKKEGLSGDNDIRKTFLEHPNILTQHGNNRLNEGFILNDNKYEVEVVDLFNKVASKYSIIDFDVVTFDKQYKFVLNHNQYLTKVISKLVQSNNNWHKKYITSISNKPLNIIKHSALDIKPNNEKPNNEKPNNLQYQLDTLQYEYTQQINETIKLTEQSIIDKKTIEELTLKFDDVCSKNNSSCEDYETLYKQSKSQKYTIEKLVSENKSILESNNILYVKCEDRKIMLHELTSRFSELKNPNNNNEELTSQNAKLKLDNNELKGQIDISKRQLFDIKEELEKKVIMYESKLSTHDKLLEQNDDLLKQLKESKIDPIRMNELAAQNIEYKQKVDNHAGQISKLKLRISELNKHLNTYTIIISRYENDISERKQALSLAVSNLDELSVKFKNLSLK
jgi:uncharacterized protein YdcH (DUF465 family)